MQTNFDGIGEVGNETNKFREFLKGTIDSEIDTDNVIIAANNWFLARIKHLVEEQSKKFHFKNNANVQQLVKLLTELKPFSALNASNLNEQNWPVLLEKVKAIVSDTFSRNSAHQQHKIDGKRNDNVNHFKGTQNNTQKH